jgi:hypothetical protein
VTVCDYCLEYELRESAFYFWRREIAKRDRAGAEAELAMASGQSAPAFLPVTVVETPAPTATAVDIRRIRPVNHTQPTDEGRSVRRGWSVHGIAIQAGVSAC